MREGDEVLFYHSGIEKAVVGIANGYASSLPRPNRQGGRLERGRSCPDQIPEAASNASANQEQSTPEEDSARAPAALVRHAAGFRRVSCNRAHGTTVAVALRASVGQFRVAYAVSECPRVSRDRSHGRAPAVAM